MNSSKQAVLDLLWNEPYKIGHWVGFKDLTALHNEWLRSFLYAEKDQTLLAHRGSYKTTDLSLFLAIHTVERPNENVMFFRKTDDDVTEVLVQTQKILKAGCMQRIVRILYGMDLKFLRENNSEIHTNLCTSTKGVSQVVGLGIGTSITGKHADIVVTDDILGKYTDFTPKFVKKYANLHDVVLNSVNEYKKDVKEGIFPSDNESFELDIEEQEKLC